MIKDLIRKKKFEKFCILEHLPIAIDSVQKVIRNGVMYNENWLKRSMNKNQGEEI